MNLRKLTALLFACLVALGPLAFAQDAKPAAAPGVESVKEDKKDTSKSVMDHVKDGGLIMIPIGICSMATVYLIVDGLLRITNFKKSIPEEHITGLKSLFRSGDYVGAYKFCKNNPSPLTNVCRAALAMSGDGKHASEEATFAEISKENAQMQYFISYLLLCNL